MQTFSSMQRNISYKKYINIALVLALFIVYESFTSIYLFLPPLLAIMFFIFVDSIKKEESITLFATSAALIFFEAQKGYVVFSSIVYFTLVYRLVILKMDQYVQCIPCAKAIMVLLAYVGYYLFSYLLADTFLVLEPCFSWYVIYYILVEFLLLLVFTD
jgi:hypothetical protein